MAGTGQGGPPLPALLGPESCPNPTMGCRTRLTFENFSCPSWSPSDFPACFYRWRENSGVGGIREYSSLLTWPSSPVTRHVSAGFLVPREAQTRARCSVTIANDWWPPSCPSAGDWLNRTVYIYTTGSQKYCHMKKKIVGWQRWKLQKDMRYTNIYIYTIYKNTIVYTILCT